MPTEQNILLQTAPLKVPVKPSYVKFSNGTPSARFSEILQSWDQGKLLQKEGQKNYPGANAIMS